MYTITLEVNQTCNLRCRYCYLENKDSSEMTYDTAVRCIDFALFNACQHKDRRIWIDLVGGEPLLSFGLLKKIVSYSDTRAKKLGVNTTFSLTTNGTIITNEILNWLISNHVHIKISIDGTDTVHNLNRVYADGNGSHGTVISNLPFFRAYEKATGIYMQATHVITQNNYRFLFDSCKYLVENLGMHIIDTALDLSYSWSESSLDSITEAIEKTILLYLEHKECNTPFLWGMIVDMNNFKSPISPCYKCGAGLISCYVRTNGDIYGCSANLNVKYKLGSLESGFNGKMLSDLKRIAEINNENCNNCKIYKFCSAKSCAMNSLKCNGSIDFPSPALCSMEKRKYGLYQKYKEFLRF